MANRFFRLRVFVDNFSMCAMVKFSREDLAHLADLKALVERIASELPAGYFEGLSLWNCFEQVWVEDYEYDGDTEVENLGGEQPWDPQADNVARTEYDLVVLDKQGVSFRADLKHTDATMTSATIPWDLLRDSTPARKPEPSPSLAAAVDAAIDIKEWE